MATSDLDSIWEAAFPGKTRPEVYTSEQLNEDGFRPLADPLDFMTDIAKLTPAQMYVQAANNQSALQRVQEEYMELEKMVNQLKSRDPTTVHSTKNPQALPPQQEYEERKEATLYGYKYDSNRPLPTYGRWQDVSEQERRDLRSFQDPFAQGGFVPNDRQYKGILNKAKDKRNPDGWRPVERAVKNLIPKMAPRVNEKEEYWQLSGLLPLGKGLVSKPVTRSGTPDVEAMGVGGRDILVNKRLRNTRFNGAKVPLTRDVSEAPSLPVSRASTPKRKRGDTPVTVLEPIGSPVKKPRLHTADAEGSVPTKRKHHNQYTKAKEKAAIDALASQRVIKEENKMSISSIAHHVPGTATTSQTSHPWSGLTDQEKRDFHWNNDTLMLAVKEDPTWLNEDPKTRLKWTKKILESKYPVRTYSMYKKWDYWRLIGEDKRPRNKKKSRHLDEDDAEVDEASEIATNTPSPLGRSFNIQDLDEADELVHASTAMSPRPSRLGRGEITMRDYSENEDGTENENDLQDNSIERGGSRRTSESDSASQTISVSRDDDYVVARTGRRTRASRKASS